MASLNRPKGSAKSDLGSAVSVPGRLRSVEMHARVSRPTSGRGSCSYVPLLDRRHAAPRCTPEPRGDVAQLHGSLVDCNCHKRSTLHIIGSLGTTWPRPGTKTSQTWGPKCVYVCVCVPYRPTSPRQPLAASLHESAARKAPVQTHTLAGFIHRCLKIPRPRDVVSKLKAALLVSSLSPSFSPPHLTLYAHFRETARDQPFLSFPGHKQVLFLPLSLYALSKPLHFLLFTLARATSHRPGKHATRRLLFHLTDRCSFAFSSIYPLE